MFAELDRILASDVFRRSDRLSAFLQFIVRETLAGRGQSLKEQVIAIELYGKGTDFNTAADPIVRVHARRLRDKLREYYASASSGPVVISVPKGSYVPTFDVAGDRVLQVVPEVRSSQRRATIIAASLALVAAFGGAIWRAAKSVR